MSKTFYGGHDDEFEAIVDGPDQNPIEFYVECTPDDGTPVTGYTTLMEALEAYKKGE